MGTLMSSSWLALASIGMACVVFGWVLRHLQGRFTERAAAMRISALCDQLDAKDAKLQALRAELQAEQTLVLELKAAAQARQALSALRLEETEDPAFFRRLVRAL
jgi:hypothetical protein